MCKWLIPSRYFADIMVGKELYVAYPALIGLTGLSLIGMILIIYFLYAKTLLKNVEVEGSAFKHVTRNRRRPIFITLLRKEFLQVFRSVKRGRHSVPGGILPNAFYGSAYEVIIVCLRKQMCGRE